MFENSKIIDNIWGKVPFYRLNCDCNNRVGVLTWFYKIYENRIISQNKELIAMKLSQNKLSLLHHQSEILVVKRTKANLM